MLSGKAFSLFPETLRIFNFRNKPMESGKDSNRFEDRLSSSRLSNPAIESGMACFPLVGYQM